MAHLESLGKPPVDRPAEGLGALVAALLVALPLGCARDGSWGDERLASLTEAHRALIESRRGRRPVEARLVGFGVHEPCRADPESAAAVPAIRCGENGESGTERLEFTRVGRTIRGDARRQASAQTLHALGVWQLLAGEPRKAVATLEKASRLGGSEAAVATDLAAAYGELARLLDRPQALAAGLAALSLEDRTPWRGELTFNRALLMSRLHLRRQAREEWRRFLSAAAPGPWNVEAIDWIRRVEATDSQGPSWNDVLQRLRDDRGPAAVESAVTRFPQKTRELLENDLLVGWASAFESAGRARGLPATARNLARELAARTGDTLLDRSLEAIERALEEDAPRERARLLARGHREFAESRALRQSNQLTKAADRFARSAELLEAGGSPFHHVAEFYSRVVDPRPTYSEALRGFLAMEAALGPEPFWSLRLRLQWMLGLMQATTGNPLEARNRYLSALELARRLGETESRAVLHNLVSGTSEYLGDHDRAWVHRYRALAASSSVQSLNGLTEIYAVAADALRRGGNGAAALCFKQEEILIAEEARDSAVIIDAYIGRANVYRELGDVPRALADLERARGLLQELEDEGVRDELRYRADLGQGMSLVATAPEQAVRFLNRAISYGRAKNYRVRQATALLHRSRARLATGDKRSAERDLEAAIEVIDTQQPRTGGSLQRSFLDERAAVFDEMVRLQIEERDDLHQALTYLERGRARALLERLDPRRARLGTLDSRSAVRAIADGTTVLVFSLNEDQLYRWRLSNRDASFARAPSRAILEDVEELRRGVREPLGENGWRRPAERLYRALVSPESGALPAGERLGLVLDGELFRIPFDLLVNPETGQLLIEEREIEIAPSLTTYLRPASRMPTARRSVLVVADPSFDHQAFPAFAGLSAAREEARAVALAYPESLVLAGAAATAERFLEVTDRFEAIHLAAHFLVNRDYPELSRILLAAARGDPNGGALLARQVADIGLRRGTVVSLATCSSAEGRPSESEGVVSLAHYFLAAGASSVVASLWPVDDRATADLFVHFHRGLASGDEPATALRAAKLEAIASGDRRALSTWAAFQVFEAGS